MPDLLLSPLLVFSAAMPLLFVLTYNRSAGRIATCNSIAGDIIGNGVGKNKYDSNQMFSVSLTTPTAAV